MSFFFCSLVCSLFYLKYKNSIDTFWQISGVIFNAVFSRTVQKTTLEIISRTVVFGLGLVEISQQCLIENLPGLLFWGFIYFHGAENTTDFEVRNLFSLCVDFLHKIHFPYLVDICIIIIIFGAILYAIYFLIKHGESKLHKISNILNKANATLYTKKHSKYY